MDLDNLSVRDRKNQPEAVQAAILREGLSHLTSAIHRLGTNDACTPMGALEVVSKELGEGADKIASALSSVADAINNLAEAVRERDLEN